MKKRDIRALVTGAGTGSSANLIRALRAMSPKPRVVGINHDRFFLKLSIADANYLTPDPDGGEFTEALLEIIKRERINVVMATNDNVVKVLSDHRRRYGIDLLLPRRETIDLCQDKYALTEFLRRRKIQGRVPSRSSRCAAWTVSLLVFRARACCGAGRAAARGRWARPRWPMSSRRGPGSRSGAIFRAQKSPTSRSRSICPGEHLVVHSLWHKGTMLRTQAIEIVSYFAAGNNPSGIFSMGSLAKTVAAPEAVRVTERAVEALEKAPSGAFFVELREAADGVPAITEINAGRFPSGVTALLAVGRDNMVAAFATAASGGKARVAAEPHGSAAEYYMVRDIDAIPAVFPRPSCCNSARGVLSRASGLVACAIWCRILSIQSVFWPKIT